MRVLYVTWGEEIAQNGVFKNQVLNQLVQIRRADSSIDIKVISGIPILTGGFIRQPLEYFRKLNALKNIFNENQINLKTIWLFTFSRWFVSKTHQTFTFRFPGILFLILSIIRFRPHIIHCRSYHPAAIVKILKRLGLLSKTKFVFDPRSLFPEEGILLKRFPENSSDYLAWKQTELNILKEADCIVCVSNTLLSHYESILPSAHYQLVFTSVDTQFFKNTPELRYSERKKEGISDGTKVLVYSGELSSKGWYSPECLGRLYVAFKSHYVDTKLVIVSTSNSINKTVFSRMGIDENDIIYKVGTSREIVKQALATADYAANAYKEVGKDNKIENMISRTVIASKTGEYLAMGLPILVNDKVGAATQFVRNYKLGISYTSGKEFTIGAELKSIDYQQYSSRCLEYARLYFSASENAQKYIRIYKDLSGIS